MTFEEARRVIAEYEREFRNPSRPPLSVSAPYDLFPKTTEQANAWPGSYPQAARRGVYLIGDDEMNVLYVGKASMSNTIGGRLSAYFSYAEDRGCRIKHPSWSKAPRFVVTVAVPYDAPFEAPALEEFLLGAISPPDNTRGVG